METEQKKQIAKKVFDELCEKYSLDELGYLYSDLSNLLWKKRREKDAEKIKSCRKGAILQHSSGSYELGGERVKLLRKGQKNATIKVMTGKHKGEVWSIPYNDLKIELTDLKEARASSKVAMNAKIALSRIFN